MAAVRRLVCPRRAEILVEFRRMDVRDHGLLIVPTLARGSGGGAQPLWFPM
jgi:hypothetical protein